MGDTAVKVPTGYKLTEVGVIPEDWVIITLKEAAKPDGLVRGPFGGSLKKDQFVDNGYKIYEQRNAIYKSISEGEYYVNSKKYLEMRRFKIRPDDFIVSCSGTIGSIYKIPRDAPEGIINQALLKITVDEDRILKEYFLFVFQSDTFQSRIKENTHGGAMQNLVGMDKFRQTEFQIPKDREEQTAIAEVLSDADNLIQAQEKLIQKKRDIKKATMQQLLTGRVRLPGFSGVWKETSLDILERGKQVKLFRGKVISQKDIQRTPGPYPIYSSSVHNEGLFGNYGKYMFDEELITWSVDGGGHFFFRPKHRFSVTNVCGYIRVLSSSLLCKFLAYCLQFQHSHKVFDYTLKAHPSVIRKAYQINIPSLNEQTAIAEVLSDMDSEISLLEKQLEKTRRVKLGMMQQLLTGRTRLIKPDRANQEVAL